MSMIKCIQNLVNSVHPFSRYRAKNQFLTSIKGRNSVEHLPKKMLYNINIDDHVYTKFG